MELLGLQRWFRKSTNRLTKNLFRFEQELEDVLNPSFPAS